jgi:hypothetical protein
MKLSPQTRLEAGTRIEGGTLSKIYCIALNCTCFGWRRRRLLIQTQWVKQASHSLTLSFLLLQQYEHSTTNVEATSATPHTQTDTLRRRTLAIVLSVCEPELLLYRLAD